MKTKISILIAVLLSTIMACEKSQIVKDTENIDLRVVTISAPIGKLHMNIWENIQDQEIEVDDADVTLHGNSNMLFLEYILPSPERLTWDDKIEIVDFDDDKEFSFADLDWGTFIASLGSLPPGSYLVPDNLVIPQTFLVDILRTTDDPEAGENYLSWAKLNGGDFKIDIQIPSVVSSIDILVDIPGISHATKCPNGFSGKITKTSTQNPTPIVIDFSELGWEIETTDKQLEVTIYFENASISNASTTSNSFEVEVRLENLQFDELRGYFGQMDFDESPESMNIDIAKIFEDLGVEIMGEIEINDVEFLMHIEASEMGVPLGILADIYFSDENGGNRKYFAEDVNFYVPASTSIDQVRRETFSTKNSIGLTSNLSMLNFSFTGNTNPDGDIPPGSNFIGAGGYADIELSLIVPFDLKFQQIIFRDTIDFDYIDIVGDNENFHKSIEEFIMYYEVDNSTPFELKVELFAIADELGNGRVPVKNGLEIASGKQPRKQFSIEKDDLNGFWNNRVKHLVVEASAKTQGEAFAGPITTDDYLEITISVRIKSGLPISF